MAIHRVLGAAYIAVSEPAWMRRELANAHEADIVYDPTAPNADIPAAMRIATSDRGADVVFDCAGTQRTLDTAFQAVRPRGTVMNVALWDKRPTIDMDAVFYKEVTFTGAWTIRSRG